MAALSDNLLIVTIMSYVVAMLLHAAEYSFGGRGVIAKAAAAPARELVGAGGPPVVEESPYAAPPAPAAPRRRINAELIGRAAAVVTAVGALAHVGTIATRALAAGRVPWGNMYEYVLAVTLLGVAVWLVTLWRNPQVRHLGLFVMLVEVLLVGVAGMVLYTPVGPLVPALDSYWFVVHIGAVATSSSLFLVGGAASAMYLVRSGYDAGKRGFLYAFGARLANAEAVERLSFRLHAFAFPIWTFGVTAGAIWAEAAWGRYWGWDPKEVWAFISWVVYAAYLHARATPSVKRSVTAWIAVLGFVTMLMNLFGVNIFFTGLHSYGGLD
ncbi:c-type cytochrome biogenesis protein CcsB [Catellatospora sp. KI3]|uniref:c-type cytochrome biogenesis protein CcsB n=1 Tax=Catellatospora sp. KI3 TaxID=3041620 RepID=UPI002482D467|nr:c-type cytochrome biogenesis protein CcsB [Catellatospora sp. KI3]MDI1461855.1 c-type cytochrome biogenesis protein CcsB [Catellatospora sp. KI3]